MTEHTADKRERGTLYLSKKRLKTWQQAVGVANEHGRDAAEVHELWTRATALAIEQYLARKADES